MLPRHVYIHVPFCARRCAYCDFSIAVRRTVPHAEYIDALGREVALRFGGDGSWRVDTLYFGGGTPSRLGGEGVARMLAMLRERIVLAPEAEVTLEANPDDVTPGAVAAWAEAGVNRLSIGGQSFDDRVLAWMHRTHDAAMIGRAVDAARRGGIENLSLDLIFALPEGIDRSWEHDLTCALALEPSHLSLYGLTFEPHTPLSRWRARGAVTEPPEARYESEFLRAHAALAAAGFEHYEVSNFGRPGLHSRHNAAYWSGASYAGLGPSAHEFDGGRRRWNVAPYAAWLGRLAEGLDPIEGSETLTEEDRLTEQVYLSLRTQHGLAVDGPEIARVQPWVSAGWARLAAGRLVLIPHGWLRLDALAAELALDRSRHPRPPAGLTLVRSHY